MSVSRQSQSPFGYLGLLVDPAESFFQLNCSLFINPFENVVLMVCFYSIF